jgi:hypothetical protein
VPVAVQTFCFLFGLPLKNPFLPFMCLLFAILPYSKWAAKLIRQLPAEKKRVAAGREAVDQ